MELLPIAAKIRSPQSQVLSEKPGSYQEEEEEEEEEEESSLVAFSVGINNSE